MSPRSYCPSATTRSTTSFSVASMVCPREAPLRAESRQPGLGRVDVPAGYSESGLDVPHRGSPHRLAKESKYNHTVLNAPNPDPRRPRGRPRRRSSPSRRSAASSRGVLKKAAAGRAASPAAQATTESAAASRPRATPRSRTRPARAGVREAAAAASPPATTATAAAFSPTWPRARRSAVRLRSRSSAGAFFVWASAARARTPSSTASPRCAARRTAVFAPRRAGAAPPLLYGRTVSSIR